MVYRTLRGPLYIYILLVIHNSHYYWVGGPPKVLGSLGAMRVIPVTRFLPIKPVVSGLVHHEQGVRGSQYLVHGEAWMTPDFRDSDFRV